MKLKTSNKLLLGYVAVLFVLIGGTVIFGFTNRKNLPESRFTANVEHETMEGFSVLHISGNASLHLNKGDAFEIIRTIYPNDTSQLRIDYSVRNDTCFVTNWERKGMNYAVLKVKHLESVIVGNNNYLYIEDFTQDSLVIFLDSGKLETSQRLFSLDQLYLTASGSASARIHGSIGNLQLDAVGSQIQVYNYLESISGEIKHGSRLELHKSVGKLDFEKSSDSRLITY